MRTWNLDGMTYPQQIDGLAYEQEQIQALRRELYAMKLRRQERTRRFAGIQQTLWSRESDIADLVKQIGGPDATLDALLEGYYDMTEEEENS